MENDIVKTNEPLIEAMFKAGAHYGYSRTKRHPTALGFLFGSKNRVEIFDLEKTKEKLLQAKSFVRSLGQAGRMILFVSSKVEARDPIKNGALKIGAPYVAGRWIGGTITNFKVIRGRVDRLEELRAKKEKGELAKYTKKERLLIDREIATLERLFSGLIPLKNLPGALFVVDPKLEHTAAREALMAGIPVVALANSDCDFKDLTYPIPANDAGLASIAFFTKEIVEAYEEGLKSRVAPAAEQMSAAGAVQF